MNSALYVYYLFALDLSTRGARSEILPSWLNRSNVRDDKDVRTAWPMRALIGAAGHNGADATLAVEGSNLLANPLYRNIRIPRLGDSGSA